MNKNLKRIWDEAVNNDDTWEGHIQFLDDYTRLILKEVVSINSQYIFHTDAYQTLIDDYEDYFGLKIYEHP